ncbi:outer membrane beta-barrel protein [Reichenbachiella sp.]|uniref:outer membrane beta-barrel protein n=1 Tax=Reichenbachiella sp. TaxID=2184521 RepID=UPI003BB097FB
MKRIFTTLTMTIFCLSMYAQEGSWYIGGMAGFTHLKSTSSSGEETTSFSWDLSPEIGTWLSEDLQLGFSPGLSHRDLGDLDETIIKSYSPGIYARKWHSFGEKVSVFGGANLAYNSIEFENLRSDSKFIGFNIYLDFGLGYAINERLSLLGRYATFGYVFQKDTDDDSKTSQFGLNANTLSNPFNIGIYYTFKR